MLVPITLGQTHNIFGTITDPNGDAFLSTEVTACPFDGADWVVVDVFLVLTAGNIDAVLDIPAPNSTAIPFVASTWPQRSVTDLVDIVNLR